MAQPLGLSPIGVQALGPVISWALELALQLNQKHPGLLLVTDPLVPAQGPMCKQD